MTLKNTRSNFTIFLSGICLIVLAVLLIFKTFTVELVKRQSSIAILGLIVVIFKSISGKLRARIKLEVLASRKIELLGCKSFIAFFTIDILPALFSFIRILNSRSSA